MCGVGRGGNIYSCNFEVFRNIPIVEVLIFFMQKEKDILGVFRVVGIYTRLVVLLLHKPVEVFYIMLS